MSKDEADVGNLTIEPHIFGANTIPELSVHLYRYKKSAIKEGITNGLDQQIDIQEPRIEVTTHVGPDDDIWIEDWGTGIENYEEFKHIGRGFKVVNGRVSSYEKLDPDIAGNKGIGKLGMLSLSNRKAGKEPVVLFYSHRPANDQKGYKAVGMKVWLRNDGYAVEYMNTQEALPHPGVRAVIKNAKYEMLPKEGELRKYIAQIFAVRLGRRAKIFLDGSQIMKPEGFTSDVGRTPLFTLNDGTQVWGHFQFCENPEPDNVWMMVKNIYLHAWTFDNKCTGWFNCDKIIPNSSRETYEETKISEEVNEKLGQYLDSLYDKVSAPKVTKMGKEKQKMQLLIDLLQYRNNLLSGRLDESSTIIGEIVAGVRKKNRELHRIDNITLIPEGGDPDAGPVIPIGDGERGKGGIRHGGKGGLVPGIKDGGKHAALTTDEEDGQKKKGPIVPNIKTIAYPFGTNKGMAWTDATQFSWNTSWPQSLKAFNAAGPDFAYIVAPIYALAVVNLDTKELNLSVEEWQEMYAKYMKFLIDKVENK